ncbi:MAG: hypothetical protein HYY16_05745 [Planctomycetes bacterium]|nr:hypothetical protein [Planctomycetota bacterium]
MGKKEILELIKHLPDDVSPSEVMDELCFRLQVEKGLEDAAARRVLDERQLKAKISRWRKSAGR